jgi:hypothetical protein
MFCEKLLDGLSPARFLFQRVFAQELGFGRPLHHQRAGRKQPANRLQALGGRQGAKAGNFLDDNVRIAWKLDL